MWFMKERHTHTKMTVHALVSTPKRRMLHSVCVCVCEREKESTGDQVYEIEYVRACTRTNENVGERACERTRDHESKSSRAKDGEKEREVEKDNDGERERERKRER